MGLTTEFWTGGAVGRTKKLELRRDENLLSKIVLWQADWNSTKAKFLFSNEEKSWIELLSCKCREYNSDSIDEMDCLTSWITIPNPSNILRLFHS